jgi:hypothetical protein
VLWVVQWVVDDSILLTQSVRTELLNSLILRTITVYQPTFNAYHAQIWPVPSGRTALPLETQRLPARRRSASPSVPAKILILSLILGVTSHPNEN